MISCTTPSMCDALTLVCALVQLAGYKVKCMLAEPKGKRNYIDTSWTDPASPLSQQVDQFNMCNVIEMLLCCVPSCSSSMTCLFKHMQLVLESAHFRVICTDSTSKTVHLIDPFGEGFPADLQDVVSNFYRSNEPQAEWKVGMQSTRMEHYHPYSGNGAAMSPVGTGKGDATPGLNAARVSACTHLACMTCGVRPFCMDALHHSRIVHSADRQS